MKSPTHAHLLFGLANENPRIIPIIIVRLVLVNASSDSIDHPFDDFHLAITTIVHVNLSIIVSCIPFLKPFMDSLQTGVLASDLRTRHPIPPNGRLPISLEKISGGRKAGSGSGLGSGSGSKKPIENQKHGYSATATSSGNDDQRETTVSGTSSDEKMVIQKKTTVAVHYGDVPSSQ